LLAPAFRPSPLLLDGYQLQMEQTIIPTRLFRWQTDRHPPALATCSGTPETLDIVAAGFALGASAPRPPSARSLILLYSPPFITSVVIPGWPRASSRTPPPSAPPSPCRSSGQLNRDYDVAIKHFAWRPYAQSTILREGGGGG